MRFTLYKAIRRSGFHQKHIVNCLTKQGFEMDPVKFSRIVHGHVKEVPCLYSRPFEKSSVPRKG